MAVGAGRPLRLLSDDGLPVVRARTAAAALALLRPRLMAHGITRLGRITDLDSIGIPVWSAVRPNARSLAVSQGKAEDDEGARIGAAMEALELATAEAMARPLRRTSAAGIEAAGETALDLPGLLRRGRSPDRDKERDFIEGIELATGRRVFVPADAVTLDDTVHPDDPARDYWRSSDGLAAGNTLGEAVLQGVLERVERDATEIWRYARDETIQARCLDPAVLPGGRAAALAERFAAAGVTLRLFDITWDVALPCCFAVCGPEAGVRARRHFDLAAGAGCHLDLDGAAARAILEAAQSRLTIIAGIRDDIVPSTYRAALDEKLLVYLSVDPLPGSGIRTRGIPAVRTWGDLLGRLAEAGARQVVAVPLSDPSEPFVVAKVIVEGLENPPGDRARPVGRRAVRAMMAPP